MRACAGTHFLWLLFSFFPKIALNVAHILDFFQFGKDAIQLLQALNLQGGADQRVPPVATHVGANRGYIDADFRNDRGNITNQPGTVTSGYQYRSQVALLTHADPADRNESLAVALAITTNILAIGAVDNRPLTTADKAHNLIIRQRTAAISQRC